MGVERKSSGRYHARYIKDGKRISVGTFDTAGEARRELAIARGDTILVSGKKDIFGEKKPKLIKPSKFDRGVISSVDQSNVPQNTLSFEVKNNPLKIHPPLKPTLFDRLKAWLNRKVR